MAKFSFIGFAGSSGGVSCSLVRGCVSCSFPIFPYDRIANGLESESGHWADAVPLGIFVRYMRSG